MKNINKSEIENLSSFNNQEWIKAIKLLQEIERVLPSGVYRKFMPLNEIKICNKLVKLGFLQKGIPPEKNATIAFYITRKASLLLDTL